VGKTHIATRLLRLLRASGTRCAGMKPIWFGNSTEITSDVAALTNADILNRILNVPLLAGLGENLTELPVDWRLMLDSTREH
jgi:dethiobiotin synthetase